MPITAKERKKVGSHTVREYAANDMIYFIPGKFDVWTSINNGIKNFMSHLQYLFLGVPDSTAIVIIFFVAASMANAFSGPFGDYGSNSTNAFVIVMPFLALVFILFFVFVSAPISSYYKSRLAGVKYAGSLKSIASSLSILQPLGYVSILASIVFIISVGIFNWLSIVAIIIGVILYFISINQSLLPYFLVDTHGNRSDAISRGWLLLSNNSLKIAAINLLIFSPTMIFLLLFLLSNNWYLLIISLPLFIISEGIWYGATAYIHSVIIKGSKNNKLY